MTNSFQISDFMQLSDRVNRMSGYEVLSPDIAQEQPSYQFVILLPGTTSVQHASRLSTASLVASGYPCIPTNYLPVPLERDPLELARILIPNITDENISQQALKLLSVIQHTLNSRAFWYIKGCIPYLHAAMSEDGSVLFEWIFKDYRVGFHIEPNPQESSWTLITKKSLGEICASGYITDIDQHKLLSWLLYFIVSHL
ncbi:MAG: hypothetical protein NUV76_02950 [Candidatus Kuenenia sp.]|nr:hypothetical protein [Candidatus Kuenenia sp.]